MNKKTNKSLAKALVVIDYILIIYKIFIFFYILEHFETARNSFSKEVFSIFLLPRGIYCFVNLFRLFLRNKKYLLFLELLVNFIFTFIYVIYHEYIFFALTIVSLFTVFYPFQIKKRQDAL